MKPKQRYRVIFATLIMTVCAQLIFVWTGIDNARSTGRNLEAAARQKLMSAAEYNVGSFFSHVYSMLTYIQSSDFVEYAQSYLALRDSAEALAASRDIGNKVNQIDFGENLIESLYIIGQYDTQKSLVKHAGVAGLSDERLPTIYDMGESGLLHSLENDGYVPTFYAPGTLVREVRSGTKEQMDASRAFAARLEGHVVIDGGVVDSGHHNSTMVVLVLKKGFLADLVGGGGSSANTFSLFDPNGQLMERSGRTSQPNAASLRRSIKPFDFALTLDSSAGAAIRAVERTLYVRYGVYFTMIVLITFAITFVYSYYILLPFRKMSVMMRKQLLKFPLQRVAKEQIKHRWMPSVSLRNHLLIVFLLSVFIPAVFSGIGYYGLINQYTVKQQQPLAVQLSDQVNRNVSMQMTLYEDLLNKLSLNQTFNRLFYASLIHQYETPDVSFLQYPGIGDVSFFVLYNLSGLRKYASQYTADTSALDDETLRRLKEGEGVVWTANMKDNYSQPTVALTKAFYGADEGSTSLHPIGYIRIVLNASAMQSIRIDGTVTIVTTDPKGDVYFHNEPSAEMLANIRSISSGQADSPDRGRYLNMNGMRGIAVPASLPGANLHTLLFVSIDSIMAGNRELFDNYLIVMAATLLVALIASVLLSRWLVHPLERLKAVMERTNNPEAASPVPYKGEDEIGELINSFNGMMDQINRLMDTNIRFAEENGRNEMKQQELISLKTQAELSMLQQQINPHFLYNTLQSIGMRAQRSGEGEVGGMIYALADLFRYGTGHKGNLATLEEEIRHTRNYVAIQDLRFKDRFEVEWNVAEEALPCEVIKFILQPLVENAITHGFFDSIRKGCIGIAASIEHGTLVLTVRDNGLGIEPDKLESIREEWRRGVSYQPEAGARKGGVGLNNVYFRLQLAYKGESEMTIGSEPFEGTWITIRIPQRERCEKNRGTS